MLKKVLEFDSLPQFHKKTKKMKLVFKDGILPTIPENMKDKVFRIVVNFQNDEINPMVIVQNVNDPSDRYCYPMEYFCNARNTKPKRKTK